MSLSGLLNFGHNYLREAVERRYLSHEDDRHGVHAMLADHFFERDEYDPRLVDEFPWQLAKLGQWEALKNLITLPAIFLELSGDVHGHDLTEYWRLIGDKYDMVEAYEEMIKSLEQDELPPDKLVIALNRVAEVLRQHDKLSGAESLQKKAIAICKANRKLDKMLLVSSMTEIAKTLEEKGDFNEAEGLLRESLQVLGGQSSAEEMVARIKHRLASVLQDKARYSEAKDLLLEVIEIRERLFGKTHTKTAGTINSLAMIYQLSGDYKAAEELYRKSLYLKEQDKGPNDPETASVLTNLAQLLRECGRYQESEEAYQRALKVTRNHLGN